MAPYLPNGFEKLKTEKAYWKVSEMKEGDNRLRIMTRPICGWIDWKDNKPLRSPADSKPKPVDPAKPVRSFWACYVWDYAREGLYVLEIQQASIQRALAGFGEDPEWGDFTQYDVKIRKEGSGKDTRYSVTPVPPKPLSKAMQEALAAKPIYLENLFFGGDPWDSEGKPSVEELEEFDIDGESKMQTINAEQAWALEEALMGSDELRTNMFSHYGMKSIQELPLEVYPGMLARAKKEQQARVGA